MNMFVYFHLPATVSLIFLQWQSVFASSLAGPKLLEYIKSHSVSYDCPDVDVTEREGVITSPFYPRIYQNSLSCSWHIHGNIGDVISIRFEDIDIEESCCCETSPCCLYNWLKIDFSSNVTEHQICGKDRPYYSNTIISNSHKLWIKFHVFYLVRGGRGFKLHYKIIPKELIGCKTNEFKCENNKCILESMKCNGISDCEDGSDEKFCSNKCLSGRSCRSMRQCYDSSKHCDGVADCADFSDETDCGFCPTNLTRCGLNSTQCYNPLTQRCDRIFHCLNGEDEKDCFDLCPGKIMCDSRRGCYPMKHRCNGVAHCEDASDERNCVPELCNYEHGGFLCDNGRCIQEVWTCDRTDDCGDGSDEKSCLRNSVLTAAVMGSLICALLLVIAISCTCRLHALRILESRLMSRETPLSRLTREFYFREPPPSYAVAVAGQQHRNLCVENVHYGTPVRSNRRRSRRSRNSRSPAPPPPPPPVSRSRVFVGPDGSMSVHSAPQELSPTQVHIPSSTVSTSETSVQAQVPADNKSERGLPDSVQKMSLLGEGVSESKGAVQETSDSNVNGQDSDSTMLNLEDFSGRSVETVIQASEGSTDAYYCDSDSEPLVA